MRREQEAYKEIYDDGGKTEVAKVAEIGVVDGRGAEKLEIHRG